MATDCVVREKVSGRIKHLKWNWERERTKLLTKINSHNRGNDEKEKKRDRSGNLLLV